MVDFDFNETFSRTLGLLTPDELERVRTFRIGIAGQGGVGGHYLIALTRMGFEKFNIVDSDVFEASNSNRQVGAMVDTIGRLKVDVMREMAQSINPHVDVRALAKPLGPESIDFFFDGIDLAINAMDYLSASVYASLHDGASARGLYSITTSPFGFGASMTTFGPETPRFAECFGMKTDDDQVTQLRKFASAVTPARLPHAYIWPELFKPQPPVENIRLTTLSPSIYLAAAMTSAEVILTLLGKRKPVLAPNVLQIDLLTRAFAIAEVGTPQCLPILRDPS